MQMNRGSVLCFVKAGVSIILVMLVSLTASQNIGAQPVIVQTPVPHLLDEWKIATAGPNATVDDAVKIAETYRPKLPNRDPFTPLAGMTCAERLSKGERVVWEDATLMALIDTANQSSKLLVVPKASTNFPVDIPERQIKYVARIAAATCDALLVAAGRQPDASDSSCKAYINPPTGLSIRQMHVHVEAHTGVSSPVDDTFLQRTAAHLRSLVGGTSCFLGR